jgi:hypothetical protein
MDTGEMMSDLPSIQWTFEDKKLTGKTKEVTFTVEPSVHGGYRWEARRNGKEELLQPVYRDEDLAVVVVQCEIFYEYGPEDWEEIYLALNPPETAVVINPPEPPDVSQN